MLMKKGCLLLMYKFLSIIICKLTSTTKNLPRAGFFLAEGKIKIAAYTNYIYYIDQNILVSPQARCRYSMKIVQFLLDYIEYIIGITFVFIK